MKIRVFFCLAAVVVLAGFKPSKSDLEHVTGWSFRLGEGAEDAATRRADNMLGLLMQPDPVDFRYETAGEMAFVWLTVGRGSAGGGEIKTVNTADGVLATARSKRSQAHMQALARLDLTRTTVTFDQPETATLDDALTETIADAARNCSFCRVTGKLRLVNAFAEIKRGALRVELLSHVTIKEREQVPREHQIPLGKLIAESHADDGEWWAARQVLKEIQRLAPNDHSIYEPLAEASWRVGDFKTAGTALARLSNIQANEPKWREWYKHVKARHSWREVNGR